MEVAVITANTSTRYLLSTQRRQSLYVSQPSLSISTAPSPVSIVLYPTTGIPSLVGPSSATTGQLARYREPPSQHPLPSLTLAGCLLLHAVPLVITAATTSCRCFGRMWPTIRRLSQLHQPDLRWKILEDEGGSQSLRQLGLRNNCKILASATSPDRGKALKDEEAAQAYCSRKLSRIRAAVDALAQRHACGSLPVDDFNLELENQSGQRVNFGSENDQRAVMMGLMLHENAKSLIKKQKFKDALDVLSIAEEAFSLCDSKIIEMIDNVPILHLDTVWCHFLLRDISCLSMARARLAKSREGFQRSHGRDNTLFTLLQVGRPAELALYLRLEILEGVVAFYSGNQVESYKVLGAAKSKLDQLQVLDELLSLFMSMVYKEQEANRALRMSGQDIQSAVDFLVEERAKKAHRHQENIQRKKKEIMEQKRYGLTPNYKSVCIQSLNDLASMGFERYLGGSCTQGFRRIESRFFWPVRQ